MTAETGSQQYGSLQPPQPVCSCERFHHLVGVTWGSVMTLCQVLAACSKIRPRHSQQRINQQAKNRCMLLHSVRRSSLGCLPKVPSGYAAGRQPRQSKGCGTQCCRKACLSLVCCSCSSCQALCQGSQPEVECWQACSPSQNQAHKTCSLLTVILWAPTAAWLTDGGLPELITCQQANLPEGFWHRTIKQILRRQQAEASNPVVVWGYSHVLASSSMSRQIAEKWLRSHACVVG